MFVVKARALDDGPSVVIHEGSSEDGAVAIAQETPGIEVWVTDETGDPVHFQKTGRPFHGSYAAESLRRRAHRLVAIAQAQEDDEARRDLMEIADDRYAQADRLDPKGS